MNKFYLTLCFVCVGFPVLFFYSILEAEQKNERSTPSSFSLLPKSLQKNPELELTAITEMTESGKIAGTQAKGKSIRLQSGGRRDFGVPSGNDQSFTEADLEKVLSATLAYNGFNSVASEVTPDILIIFTWGEANFDEEDNWKQREELARIRAQFVGGSKFQAEFSKIMSDRKDLLGQKSAGAPEWVIFAQDPMKAFLQRDPKNRFLVEQTTDSIYYVALSAYDYGSTVRNARELLWQTNLTVSSRGVSKRDALPALVETGGRFFGRKMDAPEVFVRRSRSEKIKFGEMEILPTRSDDHSNDGPLK